MTEMPRFSNEQIKTAFRDAGMNVPSSDEIAKERDFVDYHMAIPGDVWSIDSDEYRDWQAACRRPMRVWVEDVLVPADAEFGDLVEPND